MKGGGIHISIFQTILIFLRKIFLGKIKALIVQCVRYGHHILPSFMFLLSAYGIILDHTDSLVLVSKKSMEEFSN